MEKSRLWTSHQVTSRSWHRLWRLQIEQTEKDSQSRNWSFRNLMVNISHAVTHIRLSVFSRRLTSMATLQRQLSGNSQERSSHMRSRCHLSLSVTALMNKERQCIAFSLLEKIEDSLSMMYTLHRLMIPCLSLAISKLNKRPCHLHVSGIQRRMPRRAYFLRLIMNTKWRCGTQVLKAHERLAWDQHMVVRSTKWKSSRLLVLTSLTSFTQRKRK